MAQEKLVKIKQWFGKTKEKWNNRITMEGILKQARESFEFFLNSPSITMEDKIRTKLIRDAYGIVLLTEVKAGLTIGGKMGTGILIMRLEKGDLQWSAPIAVGTGGLAFGLHAGVSKVDHIIFLPSPNHVKAFLGKGQFSVKGTAEAAVVNVGRDANVGVAVSNKGDAAPIMSYSFGVKGLYAGITVDLNCLMPRNECNATYYNYGMQCDLEFFANGDISMKDKDNADYDRIIYLLNAYITKKHKINLNDDDLNNTYCPPSLPSMDDEQFQIVENEQKINEQKEGKYSIFEPTNL